MRPFLRIGLPILLLTLALTASRADGAPASISQEDYWTLVARTQTEVRALEGKPSEDVRLALDGLAGSWSGVSEVQRADGTIVPVDVSFLVAALKADPPDFERLNGLLGALLEAHKSYPQNVYDASDLDPLKQILLRPEFQWRPNPLGEWLQKLWDKFMAWLDKLLGGRRLEISIPGGADLLTTVAAVLLLAVLAYVFRGLFTDLVKESKVDASTDDDLHLTSETAFRKAQNLSGQGDYRAAVRYLYLSSLLLMEERGILRYDRSRTNREYLRSVSGHPNLAKPLKSVVDVFDRVWYGFEPLEESAYKEYVDEVEELKEQKG